MEPCQSGLTYLFAKEAGSKIPRRFESVRLRKKRNKIRQYFMTIFCEIRGGIRKTEAVYKSLSLPKNACRRVRGGSSCERSELET